MGASKEAVGSTGAEAGEAEAGQEGPGDRFEGSSLGSRRGHSSRPCAHPLGSSHPAASRCQASQHLICVAALGPPACSRTLHRVGLSPDLTEALSAPSGKGPEMLRPSISFVDGSRESFDGWGNRDGSETGCQPAPKVQAGRTLGHGRAGPPSSGAWTSPRWETPELTVLELLEHPPNLPSLRFRNIKACSQ